MKKTIIILIALAAIFTTCKKEDRDEIFKSRTHRNLTGRWQVDRIIINGIDSTQFLINNDSLCTKWFFLYTDRSYDPGIRFPFWYFFNVKGYDKGAWELKKNNKEIYISVGVKNSNDHNIVNRWFSPGLWGIKEINKTNLTLVFQNDNVKFEYQFKKYKED
ncbi:MAG: hypothetical protein ACK4IK_09300 [Bacteroidia bacterium]